jgi:outer membrane protein OmpA-like peptidoglycan-associated protein
MHALQMERNMHVGRLGWRHTLLIAAFVFAAVAAAPAHADCAAARQRFEQALAGRQVATAKAVENEIRRDPICAPQFPGIIGERVEMQRRLFDDALLTEAEREAQLRDAVAANVSWRAAATLGDLEYGRRRFRSALGFYESALDLMTNRSATPSQPSANMFKLVHGKAAGAKLLGSSDAEGTVTGVLAESRPSTRGGPGGILAPEWRDIVEVPVPVPVMFKTGTAELTAVGEAAARELLQVLRSDQPQSLTLIGHTDERGGIEYNIRLSEQRVRRVAQLLAQNGVTAKISLIAKGKSEPYNRAFAPPNATRDELYTLDRRVEVRIP